MTARNYAGQGPGCLSPSPEEGVCIDLTDSEGGAEEAPQPQISMSGTAAQPVNSPSASLSVHSALDAMEVALVMDALLSQLAKELALMVRCSFGLSLFLSFVRSKKCSLSSLV